LPLRFKSILLEFDRASLGPTLSAADSSSSLDSVSTFKEPITNRYCPQRFTEAGAKVGFIHTISEDDRQKTFQLPIYLLKKEIENKRVRRFICRWNQSKRVGENRKMKNLYRERDYCQGQQAQRKKKSISLILSNSVGRVKERDHRRPAVARWGRKVE
jgi:hypothetical protein